LASSWSSTNCMSLRGHTSTHSAVRGTERPSGQGRRPVTGMGGSLCGSGSPSPGYLVVNILETAARSILYLQNITNNTKKTFLKPLTHPSHPSTFYVHLIHSLPTLSHRYDDGNYPERHLCISRVVHAKIRTQSRSNCVGRHNGSLPSFRTERIIVGSILYLGISSHSYGITPRESRSDAEHRIGIFSFLTTFPSF
jgi:hypothetical protein